MVINFVGSISGLDGYEREDIEALIESGVRGLDYLKNVGAVKDFTTSEMSVSSHITLDIPRFFEILDRAKVEVAKREELKKPLILQKELNEPEKTNLEPFDAIYEITYAENRAILLNKHFQLAKPDFNSENDLVFGYLYKNPNKKHSISDIEKAIGNKLNKSLHKIVENLGFKGNLKTAFMDVTKDTICFRNPIIQDDLDKLGISKIKLPK